MSKVAQTFALLLFLAVQLYAPVHQLSHLPGGDHHHEELANGGNSLDQHKSCHHCSHGATLTSLTAVQDSGTANTQQLNSDFAPHLSPRQWRNQQAQGPPSLS